MKEHKELVKYRMKEVFKNKNTHALFFNEIDTVTRQPEEEFLIFGEVIDKEKDEDGSTRYYFNSLGYRSDEFTKFHEGEHILFAGCSEAEGMGGNLDSSWPHIVYKKLCETKKISGFFNLSRGGWGHDIIISNIIQYIKIYGKPDKIYILFPNLSRDFKWEGLQNENEFYSYSQKTAFFNRNKFILPDGSVREQQTLEEQRNLIAKFINLVKLFEEYCLSNNIELVWSTWSAPDSRNYKRLNVFSSFIDMPDNKAILSMIDDFPFDKETYKRKDFLKKRDSHQGYLFHYCWAQKLLGVSDINKDE